MKILQVSPSYLPNAGGLEEHVKNISERLAREHEVTVFTTNPSGKLQKEEEINGVLVRRFKSFSPNNAYHLSLEMALELKKGEFDIVHGHSYHALPLYFSRYAKRSRFVVTPHYHRHGHTLIRDFLITIYRPLGKRIFADADRIIAVSNYEKELLLEDFGISEVKISVIPNGVKLSEFGDLGAMPRKSKTILFVGRLEGYKGVQHIIEVLPMFGDDFHLEIVGRGPYKGKLMQLTNKLGLTSRVKFYQDLPRGELLKMYAGASLLVLLSRYEAFSIVVAEALASKTPCIVANTSALADWIDGKNCFGINYPISHIKLAEMITEVIGKEVEDVKLWDWDDVLWELQNVYGLHKG